MEKLRGLVRLRLIASSILDDVLPIDVIDDENWDEGDEEQGSWEYEYNMLAKELGININQGIGETIDLVSLGISRAVEADLAGDPNA